MNICMYTPTHPMYTQRSCDEIRMFPSNTFFCSYNPRPFEIGPTLSLQGVSNALDVIHNSVYFAANRRLKDTTTLILAQTAVYCATVDQSTQILQVRRALMEKWNTVFHFRSLRHFFLKEVLSTTSKWVQSSHSRSLKPGTVSNVCHKTRSLLSPNFVLALSRWGNTLLPRKGLSLKNPDLPELPTFRPFSSKYKEIKVSFQIWTLKISWFQLCQLEHFMSAWLLTWTN